MLLSLANPSSAVPPNYFYDVHMADGNICTGQRAEWSGLSRTSAEGQGISASARPNPRWAQWPRSLLLWTQEREVLPALTLLRDAGTPVPEMKTVSPLLESRHTPRAEIVNSDHRRSASGTGDIFAGPGWTGSVLTRKRARRKGGRISMLWEWLKPSKDHLPR